MTVGVDPSSPSSSSSSRLLLLDDGASRNASHTAKKSTVEDVVSVALVPIARLNHPTHRARARLSLLTGRKNADSERGDVVKT